MSQTISIRAQVVFGAMVVAFAFNAGYSTYSLIVNGIQLKSMTGASVFLAGGTDQMAQAFLAVTTGYRWTMLIVALVALLSKKASHIYLVSIGVLVLNVYQTILLIADKQFTLYLLLTITFAIAGFYCCYETRETT